MKTILLFSFASVITSLFVSMPATATTGNEIILSNEAKWEALNPARGDRSPKAATLWGDRNGTVATGFLVKFVDGFSSPPHIHNVSYRGVVISGLIHNDDPNADKMWMPTGSFWTQPKGEAHITAAKGSTNVAYIEIEQGPYLVQPIEKTFDSGESSINVDASNIVWLDAANTTWIEQSTTSTATHWPKLAYLWGKPHNNQVHGTLVKLPAGFVGKINHHGSSFRAVVIKGQLQYQVNKAEVKTLQPGSYFSSKGKSLHIISAKVAEESIIYLRTDGKFKVITTGLSQK